MSAIVARTRRQLFDTRPAKRAGLILLLLAAFMVVGTSAWAYWTTLGSGTASATTGTLNDPSKPATSVTGPHIVHLSWTGSTLSDGTTAAQGYYVTRSSGPDLTACGTLAVPLAAFACDDTGVPDGTYTYTVTAVYGSWTALGAASTPAVTVDTIAPTVSTIVRAGASQSVNAGPLSWTVTFSEPVNGVTTSNFALATSGTGGTAPTITGVTPSAGPSATWTVATSETGTTGTNSGSIGLNLANGTGIQDGATNASATLTLTGATYLFDTTPPTVAVTSLSSGGGASKVMVQGTGEFGGGSVTVFICPATPCNSGSSADTGTVTVLAGGTWTYTGGNHGTGLWYASATQPDVAGNIGTSATFGPFTR